MELLLIIAGVGASMMLCASRGWAVTSKIMADACDILIGVGINNIDMSRGLIPSVYKFTYGPQKYIAYVLLAIVVGGVFMLMKEGHMIGGCIVLGVILLCNTWPGIFHALQNGWYFQFHDLGDAETEYTVGLNIIEPNGPNDPAIAGIPQDLIIAVGKGGLMYVSGIFVGRIGGIVSAVVLAFTYFFVLE